MRNHGNAGWSFAASRQCNALDDVLRSHIDDGNRVGILDIDIDHAATVAVRETAALSAWELPVTLDGLIHQPHVENFVDAVRKGTPLNCPGESAFATTVTILKINQAVAAQKMLTFAPEDFVA